MNVGTLCLDACQDNICEKFQSDSYYIFVTIILKYKCWQVHVKVRHDTMLTLCVAELELPFST